MSRKIQIYIVSIQVTFDQKFPSERPSCNYLAQCRRIPISWSSTTNWIKSHISSTAVNCSTIKQQRFIPEMVRFKFSLKDHSKIMTLDLGFWTAAIFKRPEQEREGSKIQILLRRWMTFNLLQFSSKYFKFFIPVFGENEVVVSLSHAISKSEKFNSPSQEFDFS